MPKVHITTSIDVELHGKAKKHGIMMSKALARGIKSYLNDDLQPEDGEFWENVPTDIKKENQIQAMQGLIYELQDELDKEKARNTAKG